MLKTIPFPEWTPDVPLTTGNFSNVTALANGYGPAQAFSPVTAALSGVIDGAGFVGVDGTAVMLGGTATDLFTYSGGAWTSVLGGLSATAWRFDQFGNNIIGVNGGNPITFDITTGTAAELGGSPPVSDLVATVRDQVFLAGDPSERSTLAISAYNDSAGWTPGTNQCLFVPFPSGGAIVGLCGGETGIILQERAIRRATYTGDITVWQFDEVSRDIGCMAKGAVAQAGALVFFLSERGFQICDRNQVIPIGVDKIDEFFFKTYERADIIDNIRCAINPRSTTVTWAMPGLPGRLWSYNWARQKWHVRDTDLRTIFNGFTANVTLEEIDALYPGGIDLVPYSLDASIFNGGQPMPFVVNSADVIGTMTGANMAVSIIIPPIEIEYGRRIRINGVYFDSDAVTGAVTIDARVRAGDTPRRSTSGSMRDSGRLPIRSNGRFNGITVTIPAGAVWEYITGIKIDYALEGVR